MALLKSQQLLVATVKSQEGYMGKKTNSQLDEPLANPGGKYNKYARDLDALLDFYNGKKNGYDWCDIFADWCYVTTFGRELAQKMINQGNLSCGAGVGWSRKFYKAMNRLYTYPEVGDQAFFAHGTSYYHTGIVVEVDSAKGWVYVMEGNAGWPCAVRCCKYQIGKSVVVDYGRPKWDIAEEFLKKHEESTKPATPTQPTTPPVEKEDEDMIPTYRKFEDVPEYYAVAVKKAMDQGALLGTGNGELNVSEDLCRTLTVLDRLGKLDK